MHNMAFAAAGAAWRAGAKLRAMRRRMKSFAYGGTSATLGRPTTTADEPITTNLIRQIIKSVVSRYRATERPRTGNDTDDAALLDEIDARTLEEFLISGCAVQRISSERRPEGCGPWVDIVSPAQFFVNPHRDVRGHDIDTIGMLHDWSPGEAMARLSGNNPRRRKMIAGIYGRTGYSSPLPTGTLPLTNDTPDSFTRCTDPSRWRVIEVWTRSHSTIVELHDPESGALTLVTEDDVAALEADNLRREQSGELPMSMRRRSVCSWTGHWFSPSGRLLKRVEATRHPFVLKLYPMIDGEVHPFIEDLIDRQIQVNRTLTMIDRVMAVSAKEVILMPVEAMAVKNGWNLEDYADLWSRPGAMIPYNARAGAKPEVINTVGINAGLAGLLATEMQMMEQVSGVSSALQGLTPDIGATASLYKTQADNSAIALHDIFATFNAFTRQRDALLLKKNCPQKRQ